jgi:predicted AlkP superfamily pyrophosphatase or phosphodiesterase
MKDEPRVALFLIGGLRPDGLAQANTPSLDRLIASGASTFAARTVMPSATLPCHMSLFHSVTPERHGITTNTYTPQVRPVPGLVDVFHESGSMTAAFYNWEELRDLSRPGSLHAAFYLKNQEATHGRGDDDISDLAASWLGGNDFSFAFIYLGYTDLAGHLYGWLSTEYIWAVSNADRCVGNVISALPEGCTIIVTSDHGGHEHTHGTASDEDMTIPFIFRGPQSPKGGRIERPVNIIDIAPTVLKVLGLTAPAEWTGQPINFARTQVDE